MCVCVNLARETKKNASRIHCLVAMVTVATIRLLL